MELVGFEEGAGHLRIGHLDPIGKPPFVEFRSDPESGGRRSGPDQTDDDREAHEGFPSPVHGDVGEQAVLDPIPLARPRRKVARRERQSRPNGELLEFPLPEPSLRPVAASAVRRDEQRGRAGVGGAAHDLPPPSDRAHRERRRVVVDLDTHPPLVAVQVVQPLGDRLPLLGNEEVVDPNRLGLALWPPLAPSVPEAPHQLLLVRAHRDRRLVTALVAGHLGIQLPELGIRVRMGGLLADLLGQLEAVAHGMEQVRDQMGTDVLPERLQLTRQEASAPRGPPHDRLGSAAGGGLDERLEVRKQLWVLPGSGCAPPAGSSEAPGLQPLPGPDLLEPSGDRRAGETGGPGDETNPPMAEGEGIRRRPVPTRSLGKFRGERRILGQDDCELQGRDRNGSRIYGSLIQ